MSSNSAVLDVSTDEANGTLYWVLTQSNAVPSKAQVKAGQNHLGNMADASGSQSVTTTGSQPDIIATGLVQLTTYYAHFMQQDLAGNQSNVVSAPAFTTPDVAAPLPPVLSSPTDVAASPTTANLGVTTDTANGVLYVVVTTNVTPPTATQVKIGVDNAGAPAAFVASAAVTSVGTKTFVASGLTPTIVYFTYFMHERSTGQQSFVAASDGFVTAPPPDTTAPVLTSPTGVKTGQTTASLNVISNEANGVLYWVLTLSSTPPSAAQVKAGQDNTGATATKSGNKNVTATGTQGPISVTGLTGSTTYFAYFMQEDAAANRSTVASGAAFTTDTAADTTPPILSSAIGTKSGQTTATLGVSTNEANGTLYWVLTTSGTAPTKAQVKLGQNNSGTAAVKSGNAAVTATGAQGPIFVTGLTAATTYFAYYMHEDAAANQSNVLGSAAFVTDAVPVPLLTAATDTGTSNSTADLGVTTNTANGTLYVVVTISATPPSAAQVKLGQNNTGGAAAFASNQAVTVAGAKTFSAIGLTALTNYFTYFMHESSIPNQSLVTAANGFMTAAAPTAPAAPTLTWVSLPSDNKPDFDVGLPVTPVDGTEAQVGDLLRVQRQPAGGSWTSPTDYVTRTITSGDIAGGTMNVTSAALAEASYAFRARLERSAGNSAWSADAAVTINLFVASTTPANLNLRSQASKPGAVNPEDLSLRAVSDKVA